MTHDERSLHDGIDRTARAVELMTSFAERTGLTSDRPARRYLWTDSFAVCNLFGLGAATSDERLCDLALDLVDQVHGVLGRHRDGDARSGWISGLSEDEGRTHPTRGGLRIGKPLPERAPHEEFDPKLEWDRDGQYFHYLTKWMHALDQTTRRTGRGTFHHWARELAVAAHAAFTYGPPGTRRMFWKLSVDLSRPLVPAMGLHDPLDGFVTCLELDASAAELGERPVPTLSAAKHDFGRMIRFDALATDDPLGIGGLLTDAWRLVGAGGGDELVGALLRAALDGLREYADGPELHAPAGQRLGFRELGLAIGLASLASIAAHPHVEQLDDETRTTLVELEAFAPLRASIEAFWLRRAHRESASWRDHLDIDEVMLATSLAPDGFLSRAVATASHAPVIEANTLGA